MAHGTSLALSDLQLVAKGASVRYGKLGSCVPARTEPVFINAESPSDFFCESLWELRVAVP